jgi:hypothetical protein
MAVFLFSIEPNSSPKFYSDRMSFFSWLIIFFS